MKVTLFCLLTALPGTCIRVTKLHRPQFPYPQKGSLNSYPARFREETLERCKGYCYSVLTNQIASNTGSSVSQNL